MSIEFILRHEYAYRILNLNFQSAFFIDDQSQTSPSFNYTWYERISRSTFFYRGTTRSWLNQFSNWPFSSLFFYYKQVHYILQIWVYRHTLMERTLGIPTRRAIVRDKSRRSRLRKKPTRRIWYLTWGTGVVAWRHRRFRNRNSRRDNFIFSPVLPFFVECISRIREWNRDPRWNDKW